MPNVRATKSLVKTLASVGDGSRFRARLCFAFASLLLDSLHSTLSADRRTGH